MSTDTRLLMGEIIENPEGQEKNIESLLIGFLNALISEQGIPLPPDPNPTQQLQSVVSPNLPCEQVNV